jgi:ribosomal protein S18 acetylase RimI-like enzyme
MNFKIVELEHDDPLVIDEALRLLNRTQGQGLFSREYLIEKVNSPEALVLVGFIGDRLVSAGCAEIVKDFDYYRPFDASIGDRIGGNRVGSLCTLSVHEDFQGHKLGQQVSKQRMSWLEGQGCDLVIGVSWVSGLPHTSNRVFEKLGFRAVNQVKRFYQEGAVEHPFQCPGCRVQPCGCSAILYECELQTQNHDVAQEGAFSEKGDCENTPSAKGRIRERADE